MRTSQEWEKRERAVRLLEEASSEGDETTETKQPEYTPLRALFYSERPSLRAGPGLGLLFILLCPIFCAAYYVWNGMANGRGLTPQHAPPFALITLVTALLWQRTAAFLEKQAALRLLDALGPSYDELRGVQNYVGSYLKDLDQRTRRYFHAVTNTKVMGYFLLVQINDALIDRIAEIDDLLVRPTPRNVLGAYDLMKAELVLKSAVITTSSQFHLLQVRRAAKAVDTIIQDLERGLGSLEQEIARARDFITEY